MLWLSETTGKRRREQSPSETTTFRLDRRMRVEPEIVKICRSFVSGLQRNAARCVMPSNRRLGNVMMKSLADHGLPLVQLKEQRRDLVVALQKRSGPVNAWELMQIAAVQQAISAFEDVIADLDAELEAAA
jgi:predicted P-loop ATPase/GTPase